MEITFQEGKDWTIKISLGHDWPGFTRTLADAVSTLPPRGSPDESPSAYWIDSALERVKTVTVGAPFQSGNELALFLDGDRVRARSLYELFADEVMSKEDFIELLQSWRERVIDARRSGKAGQPPETYRRVPFP